MRGADLDNAEEPLRESEVGNLYRWSTIHGRQGKLPRPSVNSLLGLTDSSEYDYF